MTGQRGGTSTLRVPASGTLISKKRTRTDAHGTFVARNCSCCCPHQYTFLRLKIPPTVRFHFLQTTTEWLWFRQRTSETLSDRGSQIESVVTDAGVSMSVRYPPRDERCAIPIPRQRVWSGSNKKKCYKKIMHKLRPVSIFSLESIVELTYEGCFSSQPNSNH